MRSKGPFRKTAKQLLDDSIHTCRRLAGRHDGALASYERLLRQVQSQTALLRASERAHDFRMLLNGALLALALHHNDWLRPVETWLPTTHKPWPQFADLANHLLARYPIPAFMTSVWFDLPLSETLPQHTWYKHLGFGHNIRTAGLPLRLTRAMAHLFAQAPHHYTAVSALRWAQVRGLGGREELARAVIATRLGKILENEEFWECAMHFFINQRSLDLAQVGPIVDFLQHQKFERREGVLPDGVVGTIPPPRPDFSMKGRTIASICRLVEEWHKQLGLDAHQRSLSWRHSPFRDFRLVEGNEDKGNMRVWTITEILSARDLFLEGKAMRNCVATYTKSCARQQTSIWSMQVENRQGKHRVLTIEVDLLKRKVCQVRRKCNRLPLANEQEAMKQWTAQEGLAVRYLM
jgi:hypothetical protein